MSRDLSRYWKTVIDTMQDGLLVVDKQGTIVSTNRAVERLTGYRKEELLGKPCTILHCTNCNIFKKGDNYCGLFARGAIRAKRCVITNKAGERINIIKHGSLLRDETDQVIGAVETLTDISQIIRKEKEVATLRRALRREEGYHGILGKSEIMQQLFHLIPNAAQSDAPVVIYGESGTGKELVAKAIHESGTRRKKPFIKVSCAALNENLLESELFGHVKGAFTGAHRDRIGRFEAAHGGDLFLDEIGDITPSTQVKLLRVLEERKIERVGDHHAVPVDVRIMTATNKNLEELVENGAFREDLFFRINVIPIHVPPLRKRLEDVPLLARAFCEAIALKGDKSFQAISAEAMEIICRYPWPGNVRELQNAMEYAFVICKGEVIEPEHLPPKVVSRRVSGSTPHSDWSPYAFSEKERLLEALRETKWNQSEAARLLGVSRVTVWKRMKKYGLNITKDLGSAL